MKRASRRRRARSAALAGLVALSAVPGRAMAETTHPEATPGGDTRTDGRAPPRRLGVVLVDPGDPTLVGRIRGQTGDLDHTVDVVPSPSAGMTDDLATSLAGDAGGTVVVWLERRHAGALVVHVRDVLRGDSLSRSLSFGENGAGDASALAEAAALIVRGALLTLASGEALGPARPPGATSSEPPPRPAPAGPASPEPADVTSVRAGTGEGGTALAGSVAYQVGLDGAGPPFHGPRAAGGVRVGRSLLGVGGTIGLGRDLDDPATRLTLARHSVEAILGLALGEGAELELRLDVAVGVAVYTHRTSALRDDVVAAAPGELVLPRGASSLVLAWFPGGGAVGLSAQGGVDVLPGSASLDYRRGSARSERTELQAVQPVGYLGVVLRTRTDTWRTPVDPRAHAAATSAAGRR